MLFVKIGLIYFNETQTLTPKKSLVNQFSNTVLKIYKRENGMIILSTILNFSQSYCQYHDLSFNNGKIHI